MYLLSDVTLPRAKLKFIYIRNRNEASYGIIPLMFLSFKQLNNIEMTYLCSI